MKYEIWKVNISVVLAYLREHQQKSSLPELMNSDVVLSLFELVKSSEHLINPDWLCAGFDMQGQRVPVPLRTMPMAYYLRRDGRFFSGPIQEPIPQVQEFSHDAFLAIDDPRKFGLNGHFVITNSSGGRKAWTDAYPVYYEMKDYTKV